jgi:hypothetical protein
MICAPAPSNLDHDQSQDLGHGSFLCEEVRALIPSLELEGQVKLEFLQDVVRAGRTGYCSRRASFEIEAVRSVK